MNPFKTIKYQLYLLQLENYELGRYWKLILNKGFYGSKQSLRKDLVWTNKVKFILGISGLLILFLTYLSYRINLFFSLTVLIFSLLLLPIFYSISVIILMPLDLLLKNFVISKARKLVKENNKVKIIGIAGSYGKTTIKNIFDSILSAKLSVLTTPDSVNTPVGIARWLVNNLKSTTDVLIIEMGEHYRGDIKFLCTITPPDISVITGVNEAHLERLKSLKNATETIFEIAEGTKENGNILLNADDNNIKKEYKRLIGEKKALFYSEKNDELSEYKVTKKNFDSKGLTWNLEIDKIGKIQAPVLGEYIIGDIVAAAIVADKLGLSEANIRKGAFGIKPVGHRLEPIKSPGNILVIDDSYNGNPDGVKQAIEVLGRFDNRRKIFITPGIVETGIKNAEIHEEIGSKLAKVADRVILIKNSATPSIAKGLKENGFDENNIIWFETAEEAHSSLGNILKPNDVILFQNDWGDQYL